MKKIYSLILGVILIGGISFKANAQFIENTACYTIQDYQGRYLTNDGSVSSSTKISMTSNLTNQGINWKFIKSGDYWLISSGVVGHAMAYVGSSSAMGQSQKNTSSKTQWFILEPVQGKADTYMIIPYNAQGRAYSSNVSMLSPVAKNSNDETQQFKITFVKDIIPQEYPTSSNSKWIIKGEDEYDFFGIYESYGEYSLVEIYTSKDSIALPTSITIGEEEFNIQSLGKYSTSYLCNTALNLKTITIPSSYRVLSLDWSNIENLKNIYLQGDIENEGYSMPYGLNMYVQKECYASYISKKYSNSSWSNVNILPNGWELEWTVVDVKRKGEFAQTYIEMMNGDWSSAFDVKVKGALNSTDLSNIIKLNYLERLDLTEATFSELPDNFMGDKKSLKEIYLPNSLTSISLYAFYGCKNLCKVVAPGIEKIGSCAFYNCSSLQDFNIEDVKEIYNEAFRSCVKYNPSSLSPQLKILESGAFGGTGITNVSIPEGITYIASSAFNNCPNLQKVTLPSTIKSIESSAFSECSNLSEINLPEGITSIGYRAFSGCSKISEIEFPSTLQTIGTYVISDCSSLKTVKCKAIVPPVADGNFTSGINLNECSLYITPFTIDAYRATNYWKAFYIMKPLNEPVKEIYINRPISIDILSEDNAVLQENPNITLDYSSSSVGQLYATGDGTLSAGVFSAYNKFYRRTNSSYDKRTTLINNADNMRADSVLCSIEFEKNNWHFISFQYDVKMKDIFGLNNTDFVIRKYNSINRASGNTSGSNWENLSDNEVLEAGKGYIIQVANNTYDENNNYNAAIVCFPSRNTVSKNNLFTSNNVVVPLEEYPSEFAHNRSWNLIGNPYPSYYDMHYLQDDFSTPIVLWRGTSYQAYSPIDDDIILRPNEAFFVQRPINVNQMVFAVDGRLSYAEVSKLSVTPGIKSYTTNSKAITDRSVFNFTIEGCDSDDRARIVINENASMDYEISCDAGKFFAEVSQGVEIYVNGDVKYDICERPYDNGKAVLGTRIAKGGQYTITLTGSSIEEWNVLLKDVETGVEVDLAEESYQFDATAGTSQNRFELTFKPTVQTSIDNDISNVGSGDVRIVNTSGIIIYEGTLDNFKANAMPGVYIVIDDEKAYKIVIK